MSAFARQWDARIAPIDEPLLSRFDGELVRESYEPWSFERLRADVPVLVNHDPDLHIGYVDQVIQHAGWHVAAFRLDRSLPGAEVAAEYVKLGMPVSVGCRSVTRERQGANLRHRACILEEISIVGADNRPGYKGAEIIGSMTLPERTKPKPPLPKSSAAVGGSSGRAAVAGEVFHSPPGQIIRRNVGQVLAVGGRPMVTREGYPIRYLEREVVVDRPDGSQLWYCDEAEFLRDA